MKNLFAKVDATKRKFYAGVMLSIVLIAILVLITNYQNIAFRNSQVAEKPFTDIKKSLDAWAADYAIQGCNSGKIVNGNIPSWSCNVCSLSQKQSRIAVWTGTKVTLSEPITMQKSFIDLISTKPAFNNLPTRVSATDALAKVYPNQAAWDKAGNIIISIGEATIAKFNDKYVWYIEERSKSDADKDGVAKVVQEVYLDASTGEVLK